MERNGHHGLAGTGSSKTNLSRKKYINSIWHVFSPAVGRIYLCCCCFHLWDILMPELGGNQWGSPPGRPSCRMPIVSENDFLRKVNNEFLNLWGGGGRICRRYDGQWAELACRTTKDGFRRTTNAQLSPISLRERRSRGLGVTEVHHRGTRQVGWDWKSSRRVNASCCQLGNAWLDLMRSEKLLYGRRMIWHWEWGMKALRRIDGLLKIDSHSLLDIQRWCHE